jgi:hypothetical protein
VEKIMNKKPRIEVLPIEQGATTDPNNINKHTQRGAALLENSIRRRGLNRSIASAGKGVDVPVTSAGNHTLEKAVELGVKEVINVYVDGSQLVNVVRTDVEPGSPEFYALAIEDNEIGKQSYSPNVDVLASIAVGENAVLSALRDNDKNFNSMLDGIGIREEERAAGRSAPEEFKTYDEDIETQYCCPKCGYKWSGKPNAGADDQ